MKIRTKNIIALLVGFVVALLVAAGGYLYFSGRPADTMLGGPGGERTFNPFGLFGDRQEEPQEEQEVVEVATTTEDEVVATFVQEMELQEVVSAPVAGARIVIRNGAPTLEYVNRADGHVSSVNLETGFAEKRSNTTVPSVQEVVWGSDRALALRYLDEAGEVVETLVGTITELSGTSTAGSFSGTFFPGQATQIDFNESGTQLFYLEENIDGSVRGVLAGISHSAPVEVFASPIREWLVSWGHNQTVELTTKPSSGVPGQFFLFNTQNRVLTHVLRDVPALTTLGSPDLSRVVYSGDNDSFALHIYNIESEEEVVSSVRTLPEKCVWAGNATLYCAVPQTIPNGNPDAWYQGRGFFTDTLWRIDAETGIAEQVLSPGQQIDMTRLSVAPDESFVSFINKRNNSLWLYRLSTDGQ